MTLQGVWGQRGPGDTARVVIWEPCSALLQPVGLATSALWGARGAQLMGSKQFHTRGVLHSLQEL